MQPSIKNDLVYLLRILDSIGKIKIYSHGFKSPADFFDANEQQPFNASLALLVNIGEQVNKISDELRSTYPEIAWNKISDFRNRIAHDYSGIDKFITYEIIKTHLPTLNKDIEAIIAEQLSKGTFDRNELNAAKDSIYYRHVDFDALNREQ